MSIMGSDIAIGNTTTALIFFSFVVIKCLFGSLPYSYFYFTGFNKVINLLSVSDCKCSVLPGAGPSEHGLYTHLSGIIVVKESGL